MKNLFKGLTLSLMIGATMMSCTDEKEVDPVQEVPSQVLAQLSAAGFSTDGVYVAEMNNKSGYVVEGDIFLTAADLDDLSEDIHVPETEHYVTYNLVQTSGFRQIKIAIDPSYSSSAEQAFEDMIDMYNDENLEISFTRVWSESQADIYISSFSEEPNSNGSITAGRAAGFPTSSGDPASGFGLNLRWIELAQPSTAKLRGVMAHEVGHCIGFRHTDYFNRGSCANGGNEGSGGIGAEFVPDTDASSGSWEWNSDKGWHDRVDQRSIMLACGPNNDFSSLDSKALDYIY